mmetsp:Transcript_6411/g.13047  ORF Transcript_6411/g.13047 Transcript_6411/m.13047 type:complete len:236 (-) Transcript_6411:48-755(-)
MVCSNGLRRASTKRTAWVSCRWRRRWTRTCSWSTAARLHCRGLISSSGSHDIGRMCRLRFGRRCETSRFVARPAEGTDSTTTPSLTCASSSRCYGSSCAIKPSATRRALSSRARTKLRSRASSGPAIQTRGSTRSRRVLRGHAGVRASCWKRRGRRSRSWEGTSSRRSRRSSGGQRPDRPVLSSRPTGGLAVHIDLRIMSHSGSAHGTRLEHAAAASFQSRGATSDTRALPLALP